MTSDLQAQLAAAEKRARYYQGEYEYLVRQMPNAIFVVDPETQGIVDANDAACRLLGYERQQLLGEITLADIHPHELNELMEFAHEVLTQGAATTERLSCITSRGRSIPVIIHGAVFEGEDGRRLLRSIVVENVDRHVMAQALLDEVRDSHDFQEITGHSDSLGRVLDQVARVAPTDSTVLLLGETGTGKELICRAIHSAGLRSNRPLVKLNCAAIPSGLIESELFGHEKGSFTGAVSQKRGRFELAHEGTIFLDEIGDIPVETQPKLLRLLQEQEFERVGGTSTIQVDVRVVAATHRDLPGMVEVGQFREDLYYRLNVFPIDLPPLRQRRDDIPVLARHFAARNSARLGRQVCELTEAAVDRLLAYAWPGNIRELENIIERAVILSGGAPIGADHVQVDGDAVRTRDDGVRPLVEVERDTIVAALRAANGKISGGGGAAELLGLKPSTLESRMKKLGISRSEP